jgi:hypothetical protein
MIYRFCSLASLVDIFSFLGSFSWSRVTICYVEKFLVNLRHFRPQKFDTFEIWTYTSCDTLGSNFKNLRKKPPGKPTRILKTLITCQFIITRRFFIQHNFSIFWTFKASNHLVVNFYRNFFFSKLVFAYDEHTEHKMKEIWDYRFQKGLIVFKIHHWVWAKNNIFLIYMYITHEVKRITLLRFSTNSSIFA